MLFDASTMGAGWASRVAASSLSLALAASAHAAPPKRAPAVQAAAASAPAAPTPTEPEAPPAAPVVQEPLPPENEVPPDHGVRPDFLSRAPAPESGPPRLYGRKAPLLRDVRLDGHVALTWDGAFGVGARADWLLIAGTFRYSTRDELAISAGCDVTFISFNGSQVVEVFPTAVLQWSIGVNDRLFFTPEFGAVGHVDGGSWKGLYPNIGFGTRYYLARSIGLQGRFGWPIAFSAGAVF
jgi:hypothetical protein